MCVYYTCSCDCKSDNEKSNGDDKRSSEYSFVSALSMSGGDGDNSYSTNSLLQVRSSFIYAYIHKIINFLITSPKFEHINMTPKYFTNYQIKKKIIFRKEFYQGPKECWLKTPKK